MTLENWYCTSRINTCVFPRLFLKMSQQRLGFRAE